MRIILSEFAQRELDEAVFFYEMQQQGLGKRFRKEVHDSIDRIKQHPKTWPIERGEVRRCFVHKFPYKVLYSVQEPNLIILAIAHQHRKPGYWMDEMEKNV